jgi:hypothetical protein
MHLYSAPSQAPPVGAAADRSPRPGGDRQAAGHGWRPGAMRARQGRVRAVDIGPPWSSALRVLQPGRIGTGRRKMAMLDTLLSVEKLGALLEAVERNPAG